MSNISKVEFKALSLSGDNYLEWAVDMEIFLSSKGLGECIMEGNNTSSKNKYEAIFHIRHHLAESLKKQYLTLKDDPLELWNALKKRYSHQKLVLLPQAQYDWKHLRFMDFKSVDEYNSQLFTIVAILKLCGEKVDDKDLIEKTLSTFHSQNVVLQQQYRAMKCTTFEELLSCLLLNEKNNELLMLNNSQRPPGATPLPEAHKVEGAQRDTRETNYVQRSFYGRGRGRGNGRGGRGRGNFHGNNNSFNGNSNRGYRPNLSYGRGRGRGISKPQHSMHPSSSQPSSSAKSSSCHRCGMDNHWAKTCRTPKYLCELYQKHGKTNAEANMADQDNIIDQDNEGDFSNEQENSMDYETSDLLKD